MQCQASERDSRDGEEIEALSRTGNISLCSSLHVRHIDNRVATNNNGQWQFLQTNAIAILLDHNLKEGNQINFELGNLVHQTTREVRNRPTARRNSTASC